MKDDGYENPLYVRSRVITSQISISRIWKRRLKDAMRFIDEYLSDCSFKAFCNCWYSSSLVPIIPNL